MKVQKKASPDSHVNRFELANSGLLQYQAAQEDFFKHLSVKPTDINLSNVVRAEEYFSQFYAPTQVLEPPFKFHDLIKRVQEDDSLMSAIDAIASSVGGFGWDLENLYDAKDPPENADEEREAIEVFLNTAHPDYSMSEFRYMTDTDVETMGNYGVEVLRTFGGDIAALEPMPFHQVRLCQLSMPLWYKSIYRHPKSGKIYTTRRLKRFRKYVQYEDNLTGSEILEAYTGRAIFFKELGCPLHLHKLTGQWNDKPLPKQFEASEMFHVKHYNPTSEYGRPPWIGADQTITNKINFVRLIGKWFQHGMLDTKLVILDDRQLEANIAARLKDGVDHLGRGIENAFALHIYRLARTGPGSFQDVKGNQNPAQVVDLSSKLDIDFISKFHPLMRKVVRSSLRMSPIFTGEAEEYSHAAVVAAKEVTEQHVLRPRRVRWDAQMNKIFLMKGWTLHQHVTRGSSIGRDHTHVRDLEPVINAGAVTINEMMAEWAKTTGTKFIPGREVWKNIPLKFVVSRLDKGQDINAPVEDVEGAGADENKDVLEESQQMADELKEVAEAAGKHFIETVAKEFDLQI